MLELPRRRLLGDWLRLARLPAAEELFDVSFQGGPVDLAGNESVTGKTLGTDLRKGKFTLPVLIFLRSASELKREQCCQLVLEEKIEEMIELLKNSATNGALNESITAGSDLIREAQCTLDGIVSNPYADALFSLGDALCEMFDQLRV